jgi:MFS family permease
MSIHKAGESSSYRWVMLTVYVLMALGLWMCWFAQAPLLNEYWGQPPLSISVRWAGLLLSLPGLVAVVLAVATGRWVDTIGVRKMMILSGVLGSIGFGLRPLVAASFVDQAILTIVAGYGLCILTACLPSTMIQWFGHEKGHTYIGIGAGSYFVGAGIGVLVTANLFGPLGAKGVFTVWSVVMVAVTILWVIFARDKAQPATAQRAAFGHEFRKVMQTGSSWLMLVYAIFISGISVCAMQFLPGQMAITRHLPPALAGSVVGIYAIAMGIGLAVLPALAGRIGKKRLSIILCVITLAIWIIYMIVPAWTATSLLVFAVALGFFFEAPWATGLTLLESLPGVTPANVGVAAGTWTMAVNTGVLFFPLIFGWILASTGGEGGSGGLWAILIGYGVVLLTMLFARDNHAVEVEAAAQPVGPLGSTSAVPRTRGTP